MTIWTNPEHEEWTNLSERTKKFIYKLTDKDEITVKVTPDTRTPEEIEEGGIPAGSFQHGVNIMRFDATQMLPSSVEDMSVVNPASVLSQRRFPAYIGVCVHESGHANYSPNKRITTDPFLSEWLTAMEEIRCESNMLNRFPHYNIYLKSSLVHVLNLHSFASITEETELEGLDLRYGMGRMATLSLGRVLIGVIEPEEAKDIEKLILTIFTTDELEALRTIWAEFVELYKTDLKQMLKLAQDFQNIIDPEGIYPKKYEEAQKEKREAIKEMLANAEQSPCGTPLPVIVFTDEEIEDGGETVEPPSDDKGLPMSMPQSSPSEGGAGGEDSSANSEDSSEGGNEDTQGESSAETGEAESGKSNDSQDGESGGKDDNSAGQDGESGAQDGDSQDGESGAQNGDAQDGDSQSGESGAQDGDSAGQDGDSQSGESGAQDGDASGQGGDSEGQSNDSENGGSQGQDGDAQGGDSAGQDGDAQGGDSAGQDGDAQGGDSEGQSNDSESSDSRGQNGKSESSESGNESTGSLKDDTDSQSGESTGKASTNSSESDDSNSSVQGNSSEVDNNSNKSDSVSSGTGDSKGTDSSDTKGSAGEKESDGSSDNGEGTSGEKKSNDDSTDSNSDVNASNEGSEIGANTRLTRTEISDILREAVVKMADISREAQKEVRNEGKPEPLSVPPMDEIRKDSKHRQAAEKAKDGVFGLKDREKEFANSMKIESAWAKHQRELADMNSPFGTRIDMKKARPEDHSRSRAITVALQKAQYREVHKTTLDSILPPGRFNVRQAMTRAGQISAGQEVTATPWKQIRRREVDNPPITLAVATDVSGSMDSWQREVSSFTWAFSHAVKGLKGNAGALAWNVGSTALIQPNAVSQDIPVATAGGGSTGCPSAMMALDSMMNLSFGSGVRVLAVITDGWLSNNGFGNAPCAKTQGVINELHARGVKVMWFVTKHNGWIPKNTTSMRITNPADFGKMVGKTIIEALSKA